MKATKWLIAISLILCAVALVACDVALPNASGNAPRAEQLAATDTKAVGFSVSRAFSSDMIIQRDEPIRVWGWAPESRNGETVTASFMGKTAQGTVEGGEWLVTFEEGFSANAALGNHMTVSCGADQVTFENVLVGDVYMVIGQSNVAYQMSAHCANHRLSLSSFVDAKAPIRLYYNTLNDTAGYPARGTEEVCEDVINGRGWWKPTVANINSFTAIGYLFAQEIVEKTEGSIPVGIIEIDGNGQPIGAFMPNQAAGETDSDSLQSATGTLVPPGVNGTHARYMYNHYMYPYEQYALAGVIWYQGESDFAEATANTYVNKFVALMEHMRSTHNLKNKDFPIYIVEFPTIYNRPSGFVGDYHTMDLGYIRAEMGSIPQRLPNSYISVSSDMFTDVNYYNGLHPDIKHLQAARLAALAGSVWYDLAPLDEATGPILSNYAVSEDRKTVTLTFTNVGDGLTTSDGGTTVRGFAPFVRTGKIGTGTVTATITAPDQVTITCDKSMYGVAYNCVMDNYYGKEINLCNSHGQIASAFSFSEMRMYQIRHEMMGEAGEPVVPSAEDTLAIHFKATADMTAIGTQILRDAVGGGSVTLALYKFDTDYATTVASEPVATETWTNLDPYGWTELAPARNRTWEAGEYLLVISAVEDASIPAGGAHDGLVCYRNGEYIADTSFMLGVTYDAPVDSVLGTPDDQNTAPAETQPDTTPESTPESAPVPAESLPATESDPLPETQAPAEGGCVSVMGGLAIVMLCSILAAAWLSDRRKRTF